MKIDYSVHYNNILTNETCHFQQEPVRVKFGNGQKYDGLIPDPSYFLVLSFVFSKSSIGNGRIHLAQKQNFLYQLIFHIYF